MLINSIYGSISDYLYDTFEVLKPKDKKDLCAVVLVATTALFSNRAAITTGATYVGYKLATAEKLPNPNEVHKIYVPPQIQEDLFKPYSNKIEELKNSSTRESCILGITQALIRNTEQLCPIYIKYTFIKDNVIVRFTAHDLTNDKEIGFAFVRPFLESNNFFKNDWVVEVPDYLKGYGSDPTDRTKILLDQVTNQDPNQYKNIGVILIKAILQYYKQECGGRMMLNAVRNTQPYYYKLGFRISNQNNQQLNATFARMARSNHIGTKDNGGHYMHLPEQAIDLWSNEIEKNPIGFPFIDSAKKTIHF